MSSNLVCYYISFLIGRKRTVNFRYHCLWRHTCRLNNNHVKDTQGTGNHVMYDRGAWFLRIIMSSSRAFVWRAVGEKAKQRPGLQVNVYCRDISFFVQYIIKLQQCLQSSNDDDGREHVRCRNVWVHCSEISLLSSQPVHGDFLQFNNHGSRPPVELHWNKSC